MSSMRKPSCSTAGKEPQAGGPSAQHLGRLVLAVTLALLIGMLGGSVLYLLLAGG
jgi:hypothetical protein